MEDHVPYAEMVWSERGLWYRDRIEAFQFDALKRQLTYVYERSDFYRAIFDAAGFHPAEFRSLADLRRLPLTKKADYLRAIDSAPPWGGQLACDPVDIEIGRAHV